MGIVRKNYGSTIVIVPDNNNKRAALSDKMLPLFLKKLNFTNDINQKKSAADGGPIIDAKIDHVHRPELYFALFLCGYVVYLVFGASIFCYLEAPGEMELTFNLQMTKSTFRAKYPNVKDEDLENLLSEVVRASNRGVSAANNVSGEPNWSFGQSLFFSSTVVTTIGYGHVTPLSRGGKIFCMVYALIGIPLTLVLLSAVVERLLIPTVWFLQWLNARLEHSYQPFNIRLLHLSIIVASFLIMFILIPAAAFARIEPDWDYLDALYYCFISLTTIGLGDYIPGDSPAQPYRPFYKIATTVYLFIGIVFLMLTLSVFYEIPQLNLGLLFKSCNDDDDDTEKVRLAGGSGLGLLNYGIDVQLYKNPNDGPTVTANDGTQQQHRRVVRVRSRRDDSPDEEDDPGAATIKAKELMVP